MKSEFGIFTTDSHLVVRTWDAWLEQATSRKAAQVCGRPLTELFPEIESRGLLAAFRRVLDTGAVELLAPALHGYLISCAARPGTGQSQRMQQRTVIAPLREGTEICGVVVTIEDVTARRESETADLTALTNSDWGARREAVERLLAEPSETPVAELIRRLRDEHRDPNVLNSVLHLLSSGAWDTFDPLVELTTDDDAEVRMYAALALGSLKHRGAIPVLVCLLKDPDLNVRYHAIESLAKLRASDAAHPLAEIAESGEFFLAFSALDALGAIGDPTVALRLVPLLDNDTLRPASISALSQLGDHSVVAPLVALLEQPKLVPTVVEALTKLHRRYDDELGEGEYIADLVRTHISTAGTQNLLDSLNTARGEILRMTVRILGWVGTGSERVIGGLTRLLGSPSLRSEVMETMVRHGDRVTRPLCRQLESEDPEIRRAAIVALGRIGDPSCVPKLIRVLDVPEVSVEAAGALARIGDRRAYEPLLRLLQHDRAAIRQAAVGALNSLGHPRMPEDIRRLLADDNPHTRECAVRIAGYFGYAECAALLIDRLDDTNENVRRAVVEILPNLDDERIVPLLRTALRDTSAKIRTAAAQSFGHLESPVGLGDVIHALSDPDAWVRYYAARALGQIRSPESLDALAGALREDEAPQVRIAAAEALGTIGGRRAVSILAPFVGFENRDLARSALRALGVIGHPDALGPILHGLRSDDASVREDAARALAARRNREAAETLQWTAAADTNDAVVDAAIEELARMAIPESIAALIRLTCDRRVRERAVSALSSLGPNHLEHIKAGLSSPNLETRRAVIDALGRMRHPEASEVIRTALDDERAEVRLAALVALKRLGSLTSEKKIWNMAHTDPDAGVRMAAEQALQR